MRRYSPKLLSCILLLVLCIVFVSAISVGPVAISFHDSVSAIFSVLSSDISKQINHHLIVTQIRIPRALLAIIIGACLASCGAAMQGLFRNPLADPSLIGVSSGAMVGASMAIVLGSHWMASTGLYSLSVVVLGAFIGGVVATSLVYRLATSSSGTSVSTMLLAGIAITALAGGLNHLFEFFSDNDMLRRISLWKMGGLDSANWIKVSLAFVVVLPVTFFICRFSTALNAMLLGESEARHLGIAVERTKKQLVVLVALGVGTAVALSGLIAFVGLIVPHIVRSLIGPNHRYVLPVSALAGSVLLLSADLLARIIIAPLELPVGVVTSLLGAPFFISLLRQRHKLGLH